MSDVPSSTPMGGGDKKVYAPKEWAEFMRYLMKSDPKGFDSRLAGEPAVIPLTNDSWQKINSVASSLPLKTYQHQPDQPWRDDTSATVGDCNVMALSRRRALAEAGFPIGALRPAVVNNMYGEPHLVLTIETDKGTFVMDGLRPMVQPWQRAPYKWRMRLDGHQWEQFDP